MINEDNSGLAFINNPSQLTQGLAHQTSLQPHMRITHIAVNLGLGRQRCHAVYHNQVHGVRAHQCFGNFERLLAVIWLRNQQVFGINPKLFSVAWVQRVLGIDKGGRTALLLDLGNSV